MTQIIFTIPDGKMQKVIDTMKWLFPIPRTDGVRDFTDNQWAKEAVCRWIRDQGARWAKKSAIDAINIVVDDSIIT